MMEQCRGTPWTQGDEDVKKDIWYNQQE